MRILRSLRRAARDGTAGACWGKQSGIADLNPSHIIPRRRMAAWAMEYGTVYCGQRGWPAGGSQNLNYYTGIFQGKVINFPAV